MKPNEIFENNMLRRIPMASLALAIDFAMEHVPEEYVVAHTCRKLLHKWVQTGKGADKLFTNQPTLHNECERARLRFGEWQHAEADRISVAAKESTVVTADMKKGKKQKKVEIAKPSESSTGKQPLYAYMAVRAMECAVNLALKAPVSEIVDLLECLDDVPAMYDEGEETSESLTGALESFNDIFDRTRWIAIVNAA